MFLFFFVESTCNAWRVEPRSSLWPNFQRRGHLLQLPCHLFVAFVSHHEVWNMQCSWNILQAGQRHIAICLKTFGGKGRQTKARSPAGLLKGPLKAALPANLLVMASNLLAMDCPEALQALKALLKVRKVPTRSHEICRVTRGSESSIDEGRGCPLTQPELGLLWRTLAKRVWHRINEEPFGIY